MNEAQAGSLKRVLIANRGEIAVRIARAAVSLGIETVAVYSEADADSLHIRFCDQAVMLPGGPIDAYLDVEKIVATAVGSACDAIHPGYGFLAENALLARASEAAGVCFVGPRAETLELFGDKVAARELAASLDIPIIPGLGPLHTKDEARSAAAQIGFPLMLKATAGGGGRGMRVVKEADELDEALSRCQSEAMAAFGNDRLFMETLVESPRHIEVQVIADRHGEVAHLYERDCSVQQRHQKVIEIAPAPHLDPAIREQLHASALRLIEAADYVNAGTVEFLLEPETDRFYFIECNPRIQVEHTVTEAILDVDLMASQFRIAAGESLASIGLTRDGLEPRGWAVQARVVTQGTGILRAYKEPGGIGVRVDSHAYSGYAPPPQFDPLLAKVIGYSARSFEAAVQTTRRALDEFHISGVTTNLDQLIATLNHESVLAGDARTTFLATSDLPPAGRSSLRTHLEQRTRSARLGSFAEPANDRSASGLSIADGLVGVDCPMAGAVVSLSVSVGDAVTAGAPIAVISAMKMETTVTATCAGTVRDLANLEIGESVGAGQVIATIAPGDDVSAASGERQAAWQATLDDVATLKRLATERLAPGSTDPGVVRQRNRGKLTCRERIDLLLDEGTFREVGSIAGFASYDDAGEISAFTPANHVGGWGEIEGRTNIVCADDFTSRGGHADGAIGAKSLYLDRLSMELRTPSIRLLDGSSGGGSVAAMVPQQKQKGESDAKESSGAIKAGRPRVAGSGGSFLPGHLGSSVYTKQLSTVPVVNMLLGSVVGIGAAKAVLGHFSVMVKDIAQLFVAGPPVVSHAMGYDITKEDLGGWHIHCTNGSVDNLAQSEEEAVAMARQFLSYLPSSVYEAPPVLPCDDPIHRAEEELLSIIPRKRTSTFDIRRTIALLADRGSFFETGPLWGTDQVTGFVRFNGHPLGVIASDSRHANGGALTADGCDKLTRHLDICDTFNLPVLNLIDNPGFAVGVEHEIAGTIRKGGEWMVAFSQINVPLFSVLLRRSFGVAGNNYATPLNRPNVRVAWPSADVGGIPPEGGIEAAYKRQLAEAEDPVALRAELEARIESARGPVGPLNKFQVEEMIDPRHTRRLICEWVPQAYRIINQGDRLGPRALQFRP